MIWCGRYIAYDIVRRIIFLVDFFEFSSVRGTGQRDGDSEAWGGVMGYIMHMF